MIYERLEKLKQVVKGKKVLILTHNNPDPDAVATGWALSFLLKGKFKIGSVLVYGGLITRAENRTMIRLLNISIKPLEMVNIHSFRTVALVDTQPGVGNNSLPPSVRPSIVIDHHGLRKATQGVDFTDVRPNCGSAATILTEYLIEAGLAIKRKMATALYYGIKTDTQDLGRNATDADYKAAITLYPNMDLKALSRIEHPELPRNYFANLDRALHEAKIYGDVILCDLGLLTSPDMVALTSDFLIRISGVRWSFVMGADDFRFIFSLRTRRPNQNAALVARRLINGLGLAGGHGMVAGGQIVKRGFPSEKQKRIAETLQKRFLKIVGRETANEERLLPMEGEI